MSRIRRKNKYSKQAAITAKATDEKIAERIGEWQDLSEESIEGMYPKTSPEAMAEIKKLHADIAQSTDKAQRLAFVKKFVKGATEGAKKAFKAGSKLALSLAIMCLLAGASRAATSFNNEWDTGAPPIIEEKIIIMPEVAGLNLNNIFTRTRAGVTLGFDGDDYATICAPLISVMGPNSKREYFNLNVGGAKDTGGGRPLFLMSAGWRIDNYFVKFSESKFAQKYLLFAYLPPIEFGPSALWIPNEHKVKFTVTILTKFGK